MTNRDAFGVIMATLGLATNRDITGPLLELYWRALGDLTDAEFAAAGQRAVRECRFFPAVAELLAFARPLNPAEAVRAFEAIDRLATYNPVRGEVWSERRVREQLGPAAAEAFVAAGGSSAWEHMSDRDRPFVRKAFVEAYRLATAAGLSRLPIGPASRPELGPGVPAVTVHQYPSLVEET